MNTQKVTAEYRLSQWTQIIKMCHDSGKTIKDYCEESGISRNAFFYWQKKLREAACVELEKVEKTRDMIPNGWMELSPKQEQYANNTLDIEINGCHITVNDRTDADLLMKVCRMLRSL